MAASATQRAGNTVVDGNASKALRCCLGLSDSRCVLPVPRVQPPVAAIAACRRWLAVPSPPMVSERDNAFNQTIGLAANALRAAADIEFISFPVPDRSVPMSAMTGFNALEAHGLPVSGGITAVTTKHPECLPLPQFSGLAKSSQCSIVTDLHDGRAEPLRGRER